MAGVKNSNISKITKYLLNKNLHQIRNNKQAIVNFDAIRWFSYSFLFCIVSHLES